MPQCPIAGDANGHVCTINNFPYAVTLGGACDGGEASPVGLQDHVICSSGRYRRAATTRRRLIVLKAAVAA